MPKGILRIMLSNCKGLTAKILILLSAILVSVYPQPKLFSQPRFFAEEGTSYFSYAFNHSWIENICHPQYGYFTLYNSLVTSLATVLPLELSPFVTTYLAFMVLILASCVVIRSDIPGLNSNLKRFIVTISIHQLLYATAWLNTIGVQYVLCVIAYLILLQNNIYNHSFSVTIRCFILILCGLTGVTSCFLAPAYIYKAIILKSKQLAIYSCILICCLSFQICIFFTALISNDASLNNRFLHHDIITLIGIFFKYITYQFFVPLLGLGVLDSRLISYAEQYIASKFTFIAIVGYEAMPVLIGLVIFMFILLLTIKTIRTLEVKLFAMCFTIISILSTVLSINMSGGPRYTYIPSIMLIVFFVSTLSNSAINTYLRYIAIMLISSSILVNMIERPILINGFAYNDKWPNWINEVQMWRKNDNYILKIWPPPWQMVLQRK